LWFGFRNDHQKRCCETVRHLTKVPFQDVRTSAKEAPSEAITNAARSQTALTRARLGFCRVDARSLMSSFHEYIQTPLTLTPNIPVLNDGNLGA
jgi:hypothetical protein